MAVEVQCRACHHIAHFLAGDLLPLVKTTSFDELRFRCSHCQSDRCRAYPRQIPKNADRLVIYRPWPAPK